MRPDVLLLDEPTNHLDLESIIWLEEFLGGYPGALLMTSHDREFMNRVAGRILEIDGGELTSYSGNYDFYERERAVAEAHQQSQFERQQAMLKKELAFIERFKARASQAAQVQSRVKKLDKIEKVEPPRVRKAVAFDFRPAPRSGEDVVRLTRVHKAYGERVVYQGLDLLVRRGERWCVLGANGAGKSTLLKLVAGEALPDEGQVMVGGSVKMGYFAQHAMELLAPQRTVWDTLQDAFPEPRSAPCERSPDRSASPGTPSRRSAGSSPAANGRGSSSPPCSTTRRTSWCSTSPRTTSTSPPRDAGDGAQPFEGRCCSSPTTAASSARSRIECWSFPRTRPCPTGGATGSTWNALAVKPPGCARPPPRPFADLRPIPSGLAVPPRTSGPFARSTPAKGGGSSPHPFVTPARRNPVPPCFRGVPSISLRDVPYAMKTKACLFHPASHPNGRFLT